MPLEVKQKYELRGQSSLKTNYIQKYLKSVIRLEAKFFIFDQNSLWINPTSEL